MYFLSRTTIPTLHCTSSLALALAQGEEVSERSKASASSAKKKSKNKSGGKTDDAALEKEWERMEKEMEAAGKMPLPGFEQRKEEPEPEKVEEDHSEGSREVLHCVLSTILS